MKPNEQTLKELVANILEIVEPLQVILFGSAARGEMSPNSDLDFLIVMPDGTDNRAVAAKLYREIKGVTHPFDLVVTTLSLLEKNKNRPGLIYKSILQEGKVIYAA